MRLKERGELHMLEPQPHEELQILREPEGCFIQLGPDAAQAIDLQLLARDLSTDGSG
jgi:hypothetical protein